MLTQIINGKIFTPQGWLDEGSVLIRDNKILEVTNCDLALIGAKLIDAKGLSVWILMFWKNRNDKSGNTSKQCGQDYLSSNPKTDYQAEKDLGRPRPQSPRL